MTWKYQIALASLPVIVMGFAAFCAWFSVRTFREEKGHRKKMDRMSQEH